MIVSLGLNVPFSLVILDDGSTTENGETQNLKDLQIDEGVQRANNDTRGR